MKKYYITVNGKGYEVEIEELKVDAEPSISKSPKTNLSCEIVRCPMPGTISKVNVNEGSMVKKGDIMFVLEAMKLENDIMAPKEGKVQKVAVEKGSAVNVGEVLAIIE